MGKCVHRAHQAAGSNGRVVGGLDGRHALRARVVAVDGSAATLTGHHLLVRALTDALKQWEVVSGPLHVVWEVVSGPLLASVVAPQYMQSAPGYGEKSPAA